MNDESTTPPKSSDDDQPATHGDLDIWGGQLSTEIAGLKSSIEELKSGQQSLESSQEAILQVVQSIDQQLKDWKDIPKKVERLHQRVFPSR